MLSRDDLQAIALFESLNDEQLDQILDRHRESSHQADQLIVMEQDWGESLFLLCDGLAKVRTYTADGDEVVMSLLGVGDVFGEMAALDGGMRSADVVALTPLRLVKLRVPPLRLCWRRRLFLRCRWRSWRLRDCGISTGALRCRRPTPRLGCSIPSPTWPVKVPRRMIPLR